jgi:hypothetical protein
VQKRNLLQICDVYLDKDWWKTVHRQTDIVLEIVYRGKRECSVRGGGELFYGKVSESAVTVVCSSHVLPSYFHSFCSTDIAVGLCWFNV